MKKVTPVLLTAFLLFLLLQQTHAQREYWGITSGGGNYCSYSNSTGFIPTAPQPSYEVIGGGVLFKTDKTGHNQQIMHKFDSATGFRPRGSLTLANNGKLYGMASLGGPNPSINGVVFEFDPTTNIYTPKKQIGGDLKGQLLAATNGKLYGTHVANEYGMTSLFSYDPLLDTIIEIHTFDFFAGYPAQGYTQMLQASNGKIYIPFSDGGGNGFGVNGVLYEYNPVNNAVTQLYRYISSAGSAPGGTLLEYSPNIFYGCFTSGDNFNLAKGGIYKYDLSTNTYSIVARMDSIGGRAPFCGLTRVGNKLYGATYAGGSNYNPITDPYSGDGIIFSFDPSTNEIIRIYDFMPYPHPDPYAYEYYDKNGWGTDLFTSFNGLLYGLTQYGSMFSYNVADSQFTSLFGLSSTNGAYPDHAKVIELCTKPYYTNYTADTITAAIGSSFSFTIHSKNAETFHWQKGASLINDTDSILSFTPFTITDTGRYTCQLTNECGTTTTKIIYLKSIVTPVTLISFNASLQNDNNILLQWQTSQEINNHYFNIQRSSDGINFTAIENVNGSGTTSLSHSYQYIDEQVPAAIIYYRLQQVDYDGQFKYSNIEVVHNKQQPISIITNNQAHTITVNFTQLQKGNIQFNLFTSGGQLIKSTNQKSVQQQVINTQGLAAGIYQLQIITADKNYTEKIIINTP